MAKPYQITPLTPGERTHWHEVNQAVLAMFKPTDSNLKDENLHTARVGARYEATLAARDAIIEELVTALRGFVSELPENWEDKVWGGQLTCNIADHVIDEIEAALAHAREALK